MALVKCPECGGQVSDTAPACPHCGAARKVKAKTSGCAWLALIFIVIFFAGMFGLLPSSSKSPGSTPDRPATPQVSEAECRKSLQCWGDRHHVNASVDCENAVEREAKFQAEWTDGMLETKFPRMLWADQSLGTLTYGGDKVKFQNGFGAWQTMTYLCTYSPDHKKVLQVIVVPRG